MSVVKTGRRALIFGVTGQDGSYLAELLLSKGYNVTGVVRRTSTPNTGRIDHLLGRDEFYLVRSDVTDPTSVWRVLDEVNPAEIYNLAAQSHVGDSFGEPLHTWQATACGALHVLEWLRYWHSCQLTPCVGPRFYQASSSEMFGSAYTVKYRDFAASMDGLLTEQEKEERGLMWRCQDEKTPMLPNSPYAVAKLAAHHLCRVYRESYGIFACSGILFNHESERRGEEFVTRKITRWLGRHAAALRDGKDCPKLRLGNLDARRDWGHAEDYVRGMWMMLQHSRPDDFVLATGEARSVEDFLEAAWAAAGLSALAMPFWVETDPSLYRPCEVPYLRGDAGKASRELGWRPEVGFGELVRRMVSSDTAKPATGD